MILHEELSKFKNEMKSHINEHNETSSDWEAGYIAALKAISASLEILLLCCDENE